jgi:hypothetical protein
VVKNGILSSARVTIDWLHGFVTPHTLWRMKKDTVRPTDRIDADLLARRFGFEEPGS